MTSHPDFPMIQRRLAALGYYSAPIDDEWGPGMSGGVDQVLTLVEKARGVEPPKGPTWPKLDPRYDWIRDVHRDIGPVPRHVDQALRLFGIKEYPGAANNPVIMGWRDAINAKFPGKIQGYSGDQVPFCGLGMAYVMLMAERDIPDQPLWALNWGKFGQDGGQPEFGDILTFTRPTGGHVAIYIAEDQEGFYHVLGFNQSDSVNIMRMAKKRMVACRQPPYVNKPASARPFIVKASGAVSHNEA